MCHGLVIKFTQDARKSLRVKILVMDKAQLQKQLAEEALKEAPDNDKLLQLSNQIAQLDESKVRFSVDARVPRRTIRLDSSRSSAGKCDVVLDSLPLDVRDGDHVEGESIR